MRAPRRYAAATVPARILVNMLSVAHGGGRTFASNLIRELSTDARGFEWTLVLPPIELGARLKPPLHVVRVPVPARPAALRLPLRLAYEEAVLPLRGRRFDILYGIADLLPPVGATPSVVSVRNLNIYDHRFYDDLRLRTLERLVRLGIRSARKVVFATRAAAEEIGPRLGLPEDRIAVVPYGIRLETFVDRPPPEHEAPYLFLPAAVERHKNFEALLDALARVRDTRLELWVAGPEWTDPPYAAEVRARIARLGLEKRVRFLGLVPYEDVLAYYRGALAFVFPSWIETFGHPVLEASFAGTPMVLSDIGAFRELAGENALYFPPDDPAALARALDAVVADPAAARARAERARERVGGFTWERSVDGLCAVFEEVLRARRA